MTKHIYKATVGVMILACLPAVPACSDKDDSPVAGPDRSVMSVELKGFSGTVNAPATTQPVLNVFQFGADGLYASTEIDKYDASSISLVKGTTTSLYCVSGVHVDADPAISEADFVLTTVASADGADSAPMFMSGCASVAPEQMSCELTMRRGVARIDLDARDADMDISRITVDDAPSASYVFANEGGKCASPVTVYTHTFENAPAGIEESVFLLFESAAEVHITVHGTADGTPVEVPAVIPAVDRSKVYTLRVYDNDASVKAEFSVADWGDGGTINGQPDMAGRLNIDRANSEFPDGVTVDYDNNIVTVPAGGVAGMKIAFMSDLRVEFENTRFTGQYVESDSIEEKHVKFQKEKAFNTPDGVVTRLGLDIDGQLKGRSGYEIKVDLRKTNMGISYDALTVRVAPSPYQVQTVEIAGSTWMAFNATSEILENQTFTEPGQTVEEMYRDNWVGTVGNFFQYGRRKGYSPWTKNDPAGNSSTPRNAPWTSPDCMPLPDGYHVSTAQEWLSLLPAGTTIPSTYTAGNGEQIKAEIVTLPGTLDDSPSSAANKANLLKRYVRFESLATGNVLIFPIGGQKSNNWDEYPGAGRLMHNCAIFWIAEDRYVWVIMVAGNSEELKMTQQRDRWNYDGFVPVRGVKNK